MVWTPGPKKQQDALWGLILLLLILGLLPLLFVLSPLLFLAYLRYRLKRRRVLRQIKTTWLTQGKDVLFIYSDRNIWKEYFEQTVLPHIQARAICRNWSKRSTQGWNEDLLEARFLKLFVRERHFCPCAVIFSPTAEPRFFFFHDAYLKWIKSQQPMYHEQERAFFAALEEKRECIP